MKSAMLVVALCGLTGVAEAAQFDVYTYTAPAGWKAEAQGDHVALSTIDQAKGWYAAIVIYKAAPGTGNLTADFATQWAQIVAAQIKVDTQPQPTISPVRDGLNAAAGVAAGTIGDKPVVAMLFVLDLGGQVGSLVVLAPNLQAMQAYAPAVKGFFGGLSVKGGDKPQPQPQPQPSGGAGKTIQVADLAGNWRRGIGISHTVVNGGGSVVGGRTDVGVTNYVVKADGSFVYKFGAIISGRYSTEEDTGRITIEDGLIVFTFDHHTQKKYRFIDWQENDDLTSITLLDAQYDPGPGTAYLQDTYGRYKPGHEPKK